MLNTSMRIDKFLWCIRYFKTRSIATDAVKKNRVWVNGELVKPSKEIVPTDSIQVRKNQVLYTLEVLQIPKSRMGAKLVSLYIRDKTDKAQLAELQLRRQSQAHYRKQGLGRPTKKDRRDLDGFMDDFDETDF